MSIKETLQNLKKNLQTVKKTGAGPYDEANHGWRDNKPYSQVWSNGMFEGYDNTLQKYWAFPQDVKINWTQNTGDILSNQTFFNDIMREVGKGLDNQTERTRNDVRRDWHITMSQDVYEGIPIYPGCTPAHADYLKRASKEITKGQWFGYFGFKLHASNLMYDTQGLSSIVSKYLEFIKSPDEMQYEIYREDIAFLDGVMAANGFQELNFSEINPVTHLPGERDFEQLTAWYGVDDRKYNLSRTQETTRMQEPTHGMSLIVPKNWNSNTKSRSAPTEITFSAIRPKIDSGMFMSDPQSNFAQFMTKPLQPNANCVSISIRGQVRSGRVADNLLEQKRDSKSGKNKKRAAKNVSQSYDTKTLQDVSKIDVARGLLGGSSGLPFLDNVEIVVAQIVDDRENKLPSLLREHGLEVVPLVNRQPDAILSTLPTYPHQIHRIRSGNANRSIMTNQMLPGIIGFSGIFRSTKPAEPFGILLGHDDSNTDFREIYTSVDAAYRENNVPGFLISGRPGSGKTQSMLQIVEQGHYQGYSVFFMNPKPDATLKPVFDHLGGVTISMSNKFLLDNPGCFDPVIFYDALVPEDGATDNTKARLEMRIKVAGIVADAIFTGLKWRFNEENAVETATRMSSVRSQISNNSKNLGNTCASHIIFGNEDTGTEPIQDEQVVEYVRSSISSSAFWKAFVAPPNAERSEVQEKMMSNRAVLMEWDGSLKLPGQKDSPKNYSPEQLESLLSVQVAFLYASSILGNGRTGGILAADESWVFKASAEVKSILDSGFREWRQLNILLLMGTQNISDWMGDGGVSSSDMSSFFARILMMAVNEQSRHEIDLFFELSGLPRTKYYRKYIVDAGVDSVKRPGQPPRGYYIDNISKFRGPMIMGPYPNLELSLGRTDKEGEEARRRKEAGEIDSDHGLLGGGLADIFDVDRHVSKTEGFDSSIEGLSGDRTRNLIKEEPVEEEETPVAPDSSSGGNPTESISAGSTSGKESVQSGNSKSVSSYDQL